MKLTLVNKTDEAKDTKSFFFTLDTPFVWKAGQYLYITLDKITKPFTIASSPTEKIIQITTRIRQDSKFKQNLNKLKIGDKVEARGPFGTFVFPYNLLPITYHLFLAGGIGITPFRSFIKYNIDNNLRTPMYLIYSNSDSEFVFKKELDKWQKKNDFIKINYIDTSVFGRIDKLKIKSFIENWKSVTGEAVEIGNLNFWSVGPKNFVDAMEDILEELKISEDHIKTEKFTGY